MPEFLRRIRSAARLWTHRREPATAVRILQLIGARIAPQYRFKAAEMAWWDDAEFSAYLERFGERDGLNADRRWMLRQLLRLVDDVPGDTAECGVWQGASSYLICRANDRSRQPRRHHLFDSFEGLSEPGVADGDYWTSGDLASSEEVALAALSEFEGVASHPGWIPERFREVEDRRFAFVHVDVDLYEPTRDSLAFFYPRLSPGGILLCDDYGFNTCPGATRAVNEILEGLPEDMLPMSGGGGFLIKGTATAAMGS